MSVFKEGRKLKLYRKRIIPSECIPLKDDEVVYADSRIIVTRWRTLHPKADFDHGESCYFLDKGIKVSRFLKPDGALLYWYCDIIDYECTEEADGIRYVFRDLLADVVILPDGFVKVVDLDEFEEALESGEITVNDVCRALKSLSLLLEQIYSGNFDLLAKEITERV